MRLALLAVLVPTTALAAPELSFEVRDRGDAVEVIAHHAKAARRSISPIRQRLEVPLAGNPSAGRQFATDPTVKQIELDGTDPRVLSVKLNLERPDVKALARFAQAIQVGDDLHLIFPRHVPAEGATVTLPEPTIPPELQPAVEAAKPPPPLPAPIHAAPAELAPAVKPPASPRLAPPVEDSPWASSSLLGALAVPALAAGVWLLKRRRTGQAPPPAIEMVAQRSLGNKAKVVWLAAGGREILVAVTGQQVKTLGQWPRATTAVAAPLPAAQTIEDAGPRPAAAPALSPAVSGILKLRERAAPIPPVNDEVATDDVDADLVWAKEILAATGGRR